MPLRRGATNLLRVRVAYGERLLHHDVHVPRRGGRDDGRVIERVRKRGDGLGLRAFDHRGEVGEERAVGQLVGVAVLPQQRGVRVEDADNLDVLASLGAAEESAHVSVHQSGNGEPERRLLLCLRRREDNHHCEQPNYPAHCLHRLFLPQYGSNPILPFTLTGVVRRRYAGVGRE